MARPRKDPGRAATTLELVGEPLSALRNDQGADVRPFVAEALETIALKLDALEAQLSELAAGQVIMTATDGPEEGTVTVRGQHLADRVLELEQRVDEAGRRMLFASERRPGGMTPAPHWIADIGRALLFDTETPDEPDATQASAAVEGSAEVTNLGT